MVNPVFEFKRKSKKVAFYKDKKRLAWLLLAVLKNNIVSFPIYILMTLLQYAYQFILLFVFSFQFRNFLGTNDDLPNFEEQILSVILTL